MPQSTQLEREVGGRRSRWDVTFRTCGTATEFGGYTGVFPYTAPKAAEKYVAYLQIATSKARLPGFTLPSLLLGRYSEFASCVANGNVSSA